VKWHFFWVLFVVLTTLLSTCGAEEPSAPAKTQPSPTTLKIEIASTPTNTPLEISGVVLDEDGPVEGAIVRVQTSDLYAISDEKGKFALSLDSPTNDPLNLTGWASGYFCSGPFPASPGDQEVMVKLVQHAADDDPDYTWLPSRYHPGEGEDQGCAECHSREGTSLPFSLPVDEWLLDAHSQSATNPRFLTMYNGTDMDGNQSPLTQHGISRDYGTFPLPPDPSKPYYGPGYRLDFPESDGNCAACHTPAAAVNEPYSTDPNRLSGVEAEGLPCDFCHKVWDVVLDPDSALPNQNAPGVLSFEFRRPHEGHQFFAGPLDDVAPGEDTYSEVQTQSAFCAPCHFGVFWDTTIYNSYGEWLQSPYSDPESGQTCQDCHMPPLGGTQFATDEAGGLTRDPETIFSHRMPGALDQDLLQDALESRVLTEVDGETLKVVISLYNDNTGHKIPSDSPLRHMLLVVEAFDMQGAPLEFVEGPTLPDWAGEGNAREGYYSGLPGKAYALILQELWTEISPSGAYWNPTRVVADTRLAPFEEDFSRYAFKLPENGVAEVRVHLVLRRAFMELMDQKGWDDPDILMAEEMISITP
jgi:mono/diheme cytochrome c family protein